MNHYAVPPGMGGGTRHVDLARRWAMRGHDVTILASSFQHFAQQGSKRVPGVTHLAAHARLRSLWTPGYSGNGPARVLDMVAFGLRVGCYGPTVSRPDVVLGSSPHPVAAVAARILARIWRRPFVFEIRDLWPQTLVDLGGLPPDGRATRSLYSLEASLIKGAEATVAVPPDAASYFAERRLRPRRLVHIPNGSDDGTDRSATSDVGRRTIEAVTSLQRRGVTVLVYAGSQGAANGVDVLVRAAAAANQNGVHLFLLGDGPERAAAARLAGALGASNVTFTGQLPKQDALAVLAQCDGAVFHLHEAPVFRYGLSPNKLVDYLASGKPVIYAGPTVPNPATGAGCAVPARAGDAASIARAMTELARMSPEERDRRGQVGRRFAEDRHSLDSIAEQMLSILEVVR